MKVALSHLLISLFRRREQPTEQLPSDFPLDYGKMIHLDAEELAERGITSAYERLMPELLTFVQNPIPTVEEFTTENGDLKARAGGQVYTIWSRNDDRGAGWVNASVALFDIVNRSLKDSDVRFYAFYGGNDLSAMFLTEDQVAKARAVLEKRSNWPYLLVDDPPHYGFPNAA